MRFDSFLQSEIDHINECAAWTDEQRIVFDELLRGRYTDTGIMLAYNIPHKRFYRIKTEIGKKIGRIISQ